VPCNPDALAMASVEFKSADRKKSCVHIVDKDLRIIPFELMDTLYRDKEKLARLAELRAERVE